MEMQILIVFYMMLNLSTNPDAILLLELVDLVIYAKHFQKEMFHLCHF